MVGDGVNDAPDIGIAMGSDSDVAKETGAVILIRDDVRDVVGSIRLSRATMRKVKQNLFWAFVSTAGAIPVAALGFQLLVRHRQRRAARAAAAREVVTMKRLLARGFWLCPLLSLMLAAAVLILLGVNWWTAPVVAVLLGCPIAVVWMLVGGRLRRRDIGRPAGTAPRAAGGDDG